MKKPFNINITVPETLEEFQAQNNLPLVASLSKDSLPLPAHILRDVYVHEMCLKHGSKCESKLCPIALALIQHFGTKDVMVLNYMFHVGGEWVFVMNEPLTNKLRDFDRGCLVQPYHFTIR